MNLQLFAEDSSVGGDSAAPQDEVSTEPLETESPVEETADPETKAEPMEGVTDTEKSVDEPATQTKQTPEQDRAFADNRRKLEAAEKRVTEIEAQRTSDREIAKKYGQYGVYSDADVAEKYGESHGVKTLAELDVALKREEQEALLQEYKDKGIDPEVINKIVAEHPDVKRARENNEAFAETQKVAEKEQHDRFLVDSFGELTKEFPDMAEANDVPQAVWQLWKGGQSGISLVDAYYTSQRKEIAAKQTDATRQATLNSIQGKAHVKGNGKGTDSDMTVVPDDVMEQYRRFNPKGTDEQFKKHYKASNK